MNCVVVNIGNTSTSVAIAIGERIAGIQRVPTRHTNTSWIVRTVRNFARRSQIAGSVISSVVPTVTPIWERSVKKVLGKEALLVSHRLKLGLAIDYPRPETTGADRLANVCGAVMRYGKPVIVADFGTAATFDVVTSDGRFVGGVIAPGPLLMTEYLADRTALLPQIRLTGRYGVVGQSTVESMRIGVNVGYRGLVRAIVSHVMQFEGLKGAKLCATGGLARWVVTGMDLPFILASDLTLYGLACIFELNVRAACRN